MKKYVFAALLCVFWLSASAQTYIFEDRQSAVFRNVIGINATSVDTFGTNDGRTWYLELPKDSTTVSMLAAFFKAAQRFRSGSQYRLRNGTRICRFDSLVAPQTFVDGVRYVNQGQGIFLMSSDLRSYYLLIIEHPDHYGHIVYSASVLFNRKYRDKLGTAYNAMENEMPVIGRDSLIDQKSIKQIMTDLIPAPPRGTKESK